MSDRFLVAGMQRSGTTVTHQLIAGHPNVATNAREADANLFIDIGNAHFSTTRRLFPVLEEVGTQRPELVADYFDLAVRQGGDYGVAALRGLKVAVSRPDRTRAMVDTILAHMPHLKVVKVARSDIVAAALSQYLFNQRKEHRLIHKGTAKKRYGSFAMPAPFLVNYAARWWRTNRELDRLDSLGDVLSLNYEADIERGVALDGRRLFAFLGLDPVTVDWITLQKSLPAADTLLTNHAEASALAARVVIDLEAGASDDAILAAHYPLSERMRRAMRRSSGALIHKLRARL